MEVVEGGGGRRGRGRWERQDCGTSAMGIDVMQSSLLLDVEQRWEGEHSVRTGGRGDLWKPATSDALEFSNSRLFQ